MCSLRKRSIAAAQATEERGGDAQVNSALAPSFLLSVLNAITIKIKQIPTVKSDAMQKNAPQDAHLEVSID